MRIRMFVTYPNVGYLSGWVLEPVGGALRAHLALR